LTGVANTRFIDDNRNRKLLMTVKIMKNLFRRMAQSIVPNQIRSFDPKESSKVLQFIGRGMMKVKWI
jgi:hypothetical protein